MLLIIAKLKVPVLAKKQHKSEQAFKFRPAQMNYFETARKINFLLETSNSILDMENCLEIETPKSGKFSSRTEHFASLVEMTKAIADSNTQINNELSSLKSEFETFKRQPSVETRENEKFSRVGNLTTRQAFLIKNK